MATELTFRAFAARGWRGASSRTVVLRAKLPLVADDAAKTWIHLAPEGEWNGHPAGPFEFDRDVFSQIIATFEAQENPIPLTYEHPDYGTGQPIPAAGWIHELEIRDDGLWAFVEFTDKAASMVKAGEYRFCSVVVVFDSIDRESGEEIGPELLEVGITNSPFIDGQQPIQLSRARGARKLQGGPMDPEQIKQKFQQLLTLLGIDPSLEGDDMRFAIMDTVNALVDFQRIADLLGGVGGGEAPAASRAPLLRQLSGTAKDAEKVKELRQKVSAMVNLDHLKQSLDLLDTEKATPDQVKQLVEGALIQQAAINQTSDSGSKGEGDKGGAAASKGNDADTTAATHEPASEPTEAAVEPSEPVAAQEGEVSDEARQAAAGEALTILESALEMDAAGVLEFLRNNAEALQGLAGEMPEGGTPSEAGDSALSRAKLASIEARVKSLQSDIGKRDETIAKLKADLEKREHEAKLRDAHDWFDGLKGEGKVTESEREHLTEVRLRDPDWTEKYIASRGPVVPMGRVATTGTPGDHDRPSQDDEVESLGPVQQALYRQHRYGLNRTHAEALERARKHSN